MDRDSRFKNPSLSMDHVSFSDSSHTKFALEGNPMPMPMPMPPNHKQLLDPLIVQNFLSSKYYINK